MNRRNILTAFVAAPIVTAVNVAENPNRLFHVTFKTKPWDDGYGASSFYGSLTTDQIQRIQRITWERP